MYERLGLGITLDFDDRASMKAKAVTQQFDNLINVSGRLVRSFNEGVASLHFEGLTVAGFALERLAGRMDYYGKKIIRGFGEIGKAVINAGAEMETYANIFDVFYKSKEEANKKIAWAMDYAVRTPFEMMDVIDTMKSMKAIGVDVDKTFTSERTGKVRTFMDAVGDLAVLAPPTQGIKGMMMGIRNLYGGNERSFTMRMDIKPSQILGHEVGKTTDEITKSLIELSEKLAPEMMEKLFGTWTQMIKNFSDQYHRLVFALNQSGFFDTAKKSLMELFMIIDDIRGEELVELGKNLSGVFEFLWKPVGAGMKFLGQLIIMFKQLAKEYPFVVKLITGITAFTGVMLVGVGAILKWSGMLLMAIAAMATFYVNIIIMKLHTNLMNTALLRSIKTLGLFVKAFVLGAILFAGALYAYEKNLFGFKDKVNEVMEGVTSSWKSAWELIFGADHEKRLWNLMNVEGLTQKFAKLIALGRLVKILFTQDLGDKVFFTDRQMFDFQALGLWDFAILMVMLKGRVESFVTGFVKGFSIISTMLKHFFLTVLAPIKAILEGIDGVITQITGKKTILGIVRGEKVDLEQWEAFGKKVGKIFGLLMGFKVISTLGTAIVSPFKKLSEIFTQLGEKIKWSGGLMKKAFGGGGTPFYYKIDHKKRDALDLMNAEEDIDATLNYSRNPFKRFKEQQRLYHHVGNLKKYGLAELAGGKTLESVLSNEEFQRVTSAFSGLPEDERAKRMKVFQERMIYDDPTQGSLSKIFMGKKKMTFGEKIVEIGGQKIKVPDVREYREGGLLSNFFSRFGGADYGQRFAGEEELGAGMIGMKDGYHRKLIKTAFKNISKSAGSFVAGKGEGFIDNFVNRRGMYKGMDDVEVRIVKSLRKAITTMREKGETRGVAGLEAQLSRRTLDGYQQLVVKRLRTEITEKQKSGDLAGIEELQTQLDSILLPKEFSIRESLISAGGKIKKAVNFVQDKVGTFLGQTIPNYLKSTTVGKVVGRGVGAVRTRLGAASSWINERTGIDLSTLGGRIREQFGERAGEGGRLRKAGRVIGGAGKGLVGAVGMGARGLGVMGGAVMTAAPWLMAAGAAGKGIFDLVSQGEGTEGFNKNLGKMTEQLQENGPEMARQFFDNFISFASEAGGKIKDFFIAAFSSLKDSGIMTDVWNGLKAGASLAWTWIQTEGVTILGKIVAWLINPGIPLLIKGLLKLLGWIVTELIPLLIKAVIELAKTIATTIKEALLGALQVVKNFAIGLLPDWAVKLIGKKDAPEPKTKPGKSHGGLWLNPMEETRIIRKDETILPPGISRKLNTALDSGSLTSGGGKGDTININVTVNAEKLSTTDARKQAELIMEEFIKIKKENSLKKGNSALSFA